jgi:uncharacterized cofD-like protein
MQLKKLNVVAIGGGHGLGRVLSTLSFLKTQLTGIVSTTDDGGSTGRLRKHSSSIAWGDLRNCLIELVDDESIGSQLFNFRFNGSDELGGHNLGNLILYGLAQIQSRPLDSIKLIRRLLKVKTSVLPMSETPTDLMAFYPEGLCRIGELSVDDMAIMPEKLMLAPLVKSLPDCVEAIIKADLIILGPGSFLTSIAPPLLVRDIANALNQRKGHCVFLDNVVEEQSPAGKLTIDEKLNWIEYNVGCMPIDTVITQNIKMHSDKVTVIHHAMSNDEVHHHHDRKKLIEALEICINELSKPVNLKVSS